MAEFMIEVLAELRGTALSQPVFASQVPVMGCSGISGWFDDPIRNNAEYFSWNCHHNALL